MFLAGLRPLLLAGLLLPASAFGAEEAPKRVLVLHSYDPVYSWSAGIMAGIEEGLAEVGSGVQLHVEYMDAKRYHHARYLENLLEPLLVHKLSTRLFDLIMPVDNPALNFVLKHRQELFVNVPVVFSGVNNFTAEMLEGDREITGVAEVTSVGDTLELALQFHPGTESVVVIGTTSNLTGRLLRDRLVEFLPQFSGRAHFEFWDNLPLSEIEGRLAQLASGQIVVVNTFAFEEAGLVLSDREALGRIRQACPVPLYSFWDHPLGRGIVGGRLTSSKMQGKWAAAMALEILAGRSPDEIPVPSGEANEYLFDYHELRRFGIDLDRLPEGSRVVNRPPLFYPVRKDVWWGILGLFGMLALLLAFLLIYLRVRRRNEQLLREQSSLLQAIIDAIPLPVYFKSEQGVYLGSNRAAQPFFGYPRSEVVGKTAREIFPPELAERYDADDEKVLDSGRTRFSEMEVPFADGRLHLVQFHKAHFQSGDGRRSGLVGTLHDITEQRRAEQALEASEARFRELFNQMGSGVAVLEAIDGGRDFTLVDFNRAAEKIQNVSREAVIGKSVVEMFPGVVGTGILDSLQRVWKTGQAEDHPAILYRDERVEGWRETHAYKLHSGEVVVIFDDISDRKSAEQEIESLARFPEENTSPVLRISADGILLYVNSSARALLPVLGGDVGAPVNDLWLDRVATVLKTGSLCEYELAWEGRVFILTMIPLSQGSYVNLYGQDVTARKQAEKALIQALEHAEGARDRVDAILRSVADGLLVTDGANRVILMNRAAEELLDTPLRQALYQPVGQLVADEGLLDNIAATLAGRGGDRAVEWEPPAGPGQHRRVIQARTAPLTEQPGGKGGVITIFRDVTRERELDRAKNEFISTAAHELRTPLTSILGFAQVLSDQKAFGVTEAQQGEFLGYICEKAGQLSKIVGDLLDLSRIQAGQPIPLDRQPCTVAELVENVIGPYRTVSGQHRFEVALVADPKELVVDRGKIMQVLENLISNAVKYSPEGGTVFLQGGLDEGYYLFSVRDEGVGMSHEQVARVFDSFFRVDASNKAIPGLGLGMAIVKSIVEAHGGRIRVESEPGQGTTVHFGLPLSPGVGQGKKIESGDV